MTDAPVEGGPEQPESDGSSQPEGSPAAEAVAALADSAALIAAERVAGDLLAALIHELSTLESPYRSLTESKQAAVIERLRERVRRGVVTACQQIAVRDFAMVEMRLARIAIGKNVAATLVCEVDSSGLSMLAESVGGRLCVVECDADEFLEGLGDAQPSPDQEEMEFDDGKESNDDDE